MGDFDRAVELLETIVEDPTVPKNIKEVCRQSLERLRDAKQKRHIRVGAVINMLDKLSQNTNLPFHTRTQVWEVASLLETESRG